MKKLNGYQIQNKKDRTNAFTDDGAQAFETLEEARGWIEAVLESFNCALAEDEEPYTAEDLIIAHYIDSVHIKDFKA